MDPRNFQRFELINDPYVYGNSVFPGILSFHTYRGDLNGFTFPKNATILDYEGLQNAREFYSPMYAGDKAGYSKIPDQRSTMFWSANNRTDKHGKGTLEFFTSDLAGKYHVVVQSLSSNGAAGSKRIELEVIGKATSQGGR